MSQWRKRPVVVDAEQWFPGKRVEGVEREIAEVEGEHGPFGVVRTKEGTVFASPGDWIITGVEGERYPCKPSIFSATYEPVE